MMSEKPDLYFGNTFLYNDTKTISLETIDINDETFFRINNYNKMKPFFMTIVSDVDLWMFISSTGGLTCGRVNAESSLFPYYTDDKIHDSIETTGSHTRLIVHVEDRAYLWKPFSLHTDGVYNISRNIYKNVLGNKLMFEEVNHDLQVRYSYTWKSSDAYGFIKESNVVNESSKDVTIKILDGIRNILPYGVNTLLQTTKSTLVDGYKRCELEKDTGLGIYTLSSILTDKAEPSESLMATTVWSKGLPNPSYLLSELQTSTFCHNLDVENELDIKGRRGSYYVSDTIELRHKESKNWHIIAELNQSAADIQFLMNEIKTCDAIIEKVEADVSKGEENLKALVFDADGFQHTANEKAGYRHFSNTLFNIMRGGIYAEAYTVEKEDLKAFVKTWNSKVYLEQLDTLNQLPTKIDYNELCLMAAEGSCRDFERLIYEYLPLTYSRRHGDPSRPWNKFSIEIAKEDGSKDLKFEGNWRDIFQNWEALSVSFPSYTESIIAKFVNASTADGYNPYRITKDGIDWELLDPEDPWSNIGYWGDHQLIYLLKLMELSKAYKPQKLNELLHKEVYVYANVPYRIKGFDDLVADPRNSIIFDDELEKSIEKNKLSIGSDAKLMSHEGSIYKVNLMEKLLVTLLAKFSNYVPEGGIWMNTQRPEWNDANNALVGYGLSMVTLYYLHRFQGFMKDVVGEMQGDIVNVSEEVLTMFNDTVEVFKENLSYMGEDISDQARFTMVKALGEIGESYRNSICRKGFTGVKKALSVEALKDFINLSMIHLKDTIRKNKRTDGLFHSYNLIQFDRQACKVSNLNEMLEGQVALLSSKVLDGKETVDVLKALRNSQIYREDQNSYMLYPNRELPKFLEKNIISEDELMASSILQAEVKANRSRFIEVDVNGHYHFNGKYRNADEIVQAIKATKAYDDDACEVVGEVFTKIFNHHAFTGRSGTFYKYEGLGCIYWHMVSKLLLATQENFNRVYNKEGMSDDALALMSAYNEIKDGIGLEKSPVDYGAFPTDAYSHTPGFAGVQQPGMTGQVKEDFITRLAELGVHVESGEISFRPVLLKKDEFFDHSTQWKLPLVGGGDEEIIIQLPENALGFTFCTVPIIYCLSEEKQIRIHYGTGEEEVLVKENTIDSVLSQKIFNRNHDIVRIEVGIDSPSGY